MVSSVKDIEKSPEFSNLVSKRWVTATILTLLVFITYYGFIIMVGVSKATLARKIGAATTLGIPLAVLVIVISFILTLIYVTWANNKYDRIVSSINEKLES